MALIIIDLPAFIGATMTILSSSLSTLYLASSTSFWNSALPTGKEHRTNVDSKNRFQEWVQDKIGTVLPKYVTERIGGPDHAPEYLARVFVNDKVYGAGKGCGKKDAEKWAAEDALSKLKAQGLI